MGSVSIIMDDELDMAVYSFEGVTKYEAIRAEVEKYYGGKLTKYKICDFTKAELDITSKDIVSLAELIRERGKARRFGYDVIVVPNTLYYGFARMFIVYAEFTRKDPDALKFLIFRSTGEALTEMRKLAAKLSL